jgi:hypothetical protein
MTAPLIKLTGKVAVEPEYLRCIWIYLVRGSEVLGSSELQKDGTFNLPVSRQSALAGGQGLHLVAGPAGMDAHLAHLPNVRRHAVKRETLEKAGAELRVSVETPAEEILRLWRTWCRWYCVSGNIVGPDGCPVPGAQVAVKSVGLNFWGFSETTEITVTADPSGHFTACFCWCSCAYCFDCWPCWPIWWECWPWWWEYDILHVIEALEQQRLQPDRAFAGLKTGGILTRPVGSQLVVGQGFPIARKAGDSFGPDASRTALIKRKFARTEIREIFPYWWWCCDNPNIIFEVTQGSTVIVNENPATETRWCFPSDNTVTLVGNAETISACSGPPIEDPFAWTRVGNIPVDTAHIDGGYAVGFAGSDTSDLAFAGSLDIYGGFGDASVAYYQVNTALWSGDPSRAGTAPTSAATLSASLYNHVYIYDSSFNLVFSGPIQMGPFNQGGLTNLYATQKARQDGPTPPGLAPFPAHSSSDFIIWAYDQLLISTASSSLIGGVSVGAVDLTINAYTSALAPVSLPLPSPPPPPPDTSAVLTLVIDNTGVTTQQVTGITAYRADGTLAVQTGTGECPAYDVGPGGYVEIDTTVSDANGHLFEYYIDAEYGHGNAVAVADPGVRGYRSNPLTSPAPGGVCGSGDPDYSCKGWTGGADVAYFPCAPGGTGCTVSPTNGQPFGISNEPPDCCYEFRLRYAKRVTNGYVWPTLADGDFQTISLKFSS